jgi:hypothetical protein
MALAAIPSTVLDKLGKLSYNFLWSSSSGYTRLHLSNWESLAKPKIKGGWGIQNLFHFNTALATNSLWHVLTKDGIRHTVIKDKYLPHCLVATWFRKFYNSKIGLTVLEESIKIGKLDYTLALLESRSQTLSYPGQGLYFRNGKFLLLISIVNLSLKYKEHQISFPSKGEPQTWNIS